MTTKWVGRTDQVKEETLLLKSNIKIKNLSDFATINPLNLKIGITFTSKASEQAEKFEGGAQILIKPQLINKNFISLAAEWKENSNLAQLSNN